MRYLSTALLCSMLLLSSCAQVQRSVRSLGGGGTPTPMPRLEKRGTVTQLIVDGRPYLMLGGELRNSSSSSMEYMRPIWAKLKRMNLNTVLAVVSWEQFEPVEGQYNYALIDGMVSEARRNDLRLVLLWFGSWKNATSRYQADWVKTDSVRFPRVINKDGKPLEILSTLSTNTLEADSRAFAAFMRHLKEIDSREHTVMMVQMQNEVGILGDSRDRSPAANEAFAKPVPGELIDYMQKNKDTLLPEFRKVWDTAGNKTGGSWEQVFGTGTQADEIFMAWNYARFCGRVAEAGKAEYALPIFVNAWIVQPEDKAPGDYPSGGPVDHVHDVWRAGAPSIDILAPDIYLPDFSGVLRRYARSGNPVFIPESFGGAPGAANAYFALGQLGAMGYSPFGIDDHAEDNPLVKAYGVLNQLTPLIVEHQAKGSIAAVRLSEQQPSQKVTLGQYILNIDLRRQRSGAPAAPTGYAMVINTGPDEYYISGTDAQVTFMPVAPNSGIVGLTKVEEGTFRNGVWTPGRRLNGDEVQLRYDLSVAAAEGLSGSGIRLIAGGPWIQRVTLHKYK